MQPARMLIRKSDLARLRGVSPAAVTRAIESGRIAAAVVTRDGRQLLDADLAQALWDRHTLQRKPAATAAEDAPPDLNDSRARLLHHRAELARMEAEQRAGELVAAADVRAAAFATARAVRDALLALPNRMAPQLAATADAREVHRLLTAEITLALRSLADG